MEFEYKEEYAWLTNICLNVTDACNLACRYCFVEQHPHYMSYEVAEKAVYFILENLEKKNKKFGTNEKASITYFGGEPTLMWDEIIVPLTTWIRENDFPISLSMTTNGTLLNAERIKFLKDNNIPILLSIDGCEETQCFNRPCRDSNKNSFELVSKNIPLILEAFPNTTFRATIYAPTADKTFENYLFANAQGFKNIFMIPDFRNKWTEEQKNSLMLEIKKIFYFYGFCFSNNQMPINFKLINKTFNNMLQKDLNIYYKNQIDLEIARSEIRCGMGTSFGSIGYDGSIYGCQEQDSKNNKSIFYIGKIDNGIDKNLHIKLLSEYNKKYSTISKNKSLCKDCQLRNICFDFNCPSLSWDLYQDFSIMNEIDCFWNQILMDEAISLNNQMIKDNNLLFKDYLDNVCDFKKFLKERVE